MEAIIASVEVSMVRLPIDVADAIRYEALKILRSARPPVPNYCKSEYSALKEVQR